MLNVEKCGVMPAVDRYCDCDVERNYERGCFAPRKKPTNEDELHALKTLMLLNPFVIPIVYDLITSPNGVLTHDPDKKVKPIVIPGDGRQVRQFVRVSTGEVIPIPVMIGSTTKVKILKDGTYEVTTKYSYLGAKEKTTVMTEEEFINKFGK